MAGPCITFVFAPRCQTRPGELIAHGTAAGAISYVHFNLARPGSDGKDRYAAPGSTKPRMFDPRKALLEDLDFVAAKHAGFTERILGVIQFEGGECLRRAGAALAAF